MNGIHDMGGMQGLGEIGYKENEPGFHEPWEESIRVGTGYASGQLASYIERIPAADIFG
jgi:hypothetical protein